jgi:hypothetical protein
VVSETCAKAIDARVGIELLSATTPTDYVHRITGLLCDPQFAQAMGRAARLRVLRSYSWEAHLSAIDRRLGALNGVEVTA